MIPKTDLEKTLENTEPEEVAKILNGIRKHGDDSDFAEMVKMMLRKLEEQLVNQIVGYAGGDNELLWNAVGRLQCGRLLTGWIFATTEVGGSSYTENTTENEEKND